MDNELDRALNTSFIDKNNDSSSDLRTKLLVNGDKEKVFYYLKAALSECDEFCLSVAFITMSGLTPLLQILKELENKGIKGKIITSDYLTFTEPKAIEKLQSFKNLDIKIFTGGNLHAKGYIFKHNCLYEIIVGSSNLTQKALFENQEWNIKLSALQEGEFIEKVWNEFHNLWKQSIIPDQKWLEEYKLRYSQDKTKNIISEDKNDYRIEKSLVPNKMQKEALESLKNLRQRGARRALLISATGTGKTYLSAFDVKNMKPKKMLFLAHREQILQQAKESFGRVINNVDMGILSGTSKNIEVDYLFSTIQMMSKNYEQFSKDYFDYIIIDESHRVGGKSYQTIIDYFEPKFLLGMTATPERTDNFNIYETFDHNIAYEIRLQQALEMDLLTPFHYFGVSDITVNGQLQQSQDDNNIGVFNQLSDDERVNHIIEKIEYYGYCGERVKGLVFCSTQEEAMKLSSKFNEKGYRTTALLGNSKKEYREQMIQKLSTDNYDEGIDYIFTVDIFNEGIDIPEINQIVMLRPTESAIVFVQQLGRGLRKLKGKDYVNIIDFIGNYKTNFLIPVALSGDKSFSKDNIRKLVSGGVDLPGASTVDFDSIAKEAIYKSISEVKFKKKFLSEKFNELEEKIGYIPLMMDFVRFGDIDPMLIIDYSNNYYSFLESINKAEEILSAEQTLLLQFMYSQLSNGMRPHELIILGLIYKYQLTNIKDLSEALNKYFNLSDELESINSAINLLLGKFIVGTTKLADVVLVKQIKDKIIFNDELLSALENNYFKKLFLDLLKFGLNRYAQKYSQLYKNTKFKLYERYSRKDVCRLLNWQQDESATVNGYPRNPRNNTIPIFVTYHKNDSMNTTTKYDDAFIDRDTFSWLSRHSLHIDSKEIQHIIQARENHYDIHLFVKKDDGEGKELYYMGLMTPIKETVNETTIVDSKGNNKPIVNMQFHLATTVDINMYHYLVG